MKSCLSIKTDYSILTSLIKIPDLIPYAINNHIEALGIIDDNLSSSMEFILECQKNNIKPLVSLEVNYQNSKIYLYAKDEQGLHNLFKINTIILNNPLTINDLKKYINNLIIILPYNSIKLYDELKAITNNIFIGYQTKQEKQSALIITNKIIYFNQALSLTKEDTKYLNYLNMIKDNLTYDTYQDIDYSNNYLHITEDADELINQVNITISPSKNLIPHYDENIKDSFSYLKTLSIKGLTKRLNGNVPKEYQERLLYELDVINKMNFVDYFLIVYDYVKYSIKNNIYVGPGRGSAAGSLVTYSLGITAIDPLKYNLLFERFLNPERVTMPDIDIDFDASKRYLVIDYVKERYGSKRVMPIMTYGTLASKQVLLNVSKILNIDISKINKLIDPKKTLKENLTEEIIKILNTDKKIKQVYYESLKLEGLKKHISTHAAGVVISKEDLDDIIPITKSGDVYLTGYTMNYLESLGLLKMDFLAIKDLTTMASIIDKLPTKININNIDLNNEEVLNRFKNANTTGIFQFESAGMKNFLRKLKPNSFNDLVVALALFRPGPMQNIDSFIKRKEGKEKVEYIVPALEPILKETYGIIVYQEQIMQIFRTIASYKMSEADLIRRAISKKKEKIIIEEKEKFILRAEKNGYSKEISTKIYDLILKFANYGFNKSHSVAYALVGYQMMYLKVIYPKIFYSSLLNINIGSVTKTKEYIDEAKSLNIKIVKPDINTSSYDYYINNDIIMPLRVIKNIGDVVSLEIFEERKKSPYQDFFDFVSRIYNKNINTKTIETLIYAGALDSFNQTRNTLINNIKQALIYAELVSGLDSNLVTKPNLEIYEELPSNELMNKELELFGFYVSNHPASKYNEIKIMNIKNYFDKTITTVGLLESIKTIKTKNNDTMAFLEISDETGSLSYTLFPNKIAYANLLKVGDLLKINGHVEKRYDKYQIIVNKIEKLK